MQLHIRHRTLYTYEQGCSRLVMLLKLKPRSCDSQSVDGWQVTVNGEAVENFIPNGQGNMEALWTSRAPLKEAVIIAEGLVHTRDESGVMRGLPPGAPLDTYLRTTPLTSMSQDMLDEMNAHCEEFPLEKLHRLSELVRQKVAYQPGITHAQTSASEAFELGAGVCQDHAQIFIATARLMGIPARYVSGYLLAAPEQGELHETHAWVEAWVPDLGWVGFDVTNGLCVTDRYVRLSCGLDAHDAAPIRGHAVAAGYINIEADVAIGPGSKNYGQYQRMGEMTQRQQQ